MLRRRCFPALSLTLVPRRYGSIVPGTKTGKAVVDTTRETDIAYKSIDQKVAELRDSQIFTMQEYIEKNEQDQRAGRKMIDAIDRTTTNPSWMLWGLGFMTFSVLYTVMCVRIRREQLRFDPQLRQVQSFDQPGGPSIGGPFSLVDVTGKKWTDKDFHGKWIYVYFGFTNCPDICPEEMSKMSRVISHIDKKLGKDYWQPLFISVDPVRDSPAKIKEYLADFHPRVLGLTGSPEEVEKAAREYRVYFAVPDESAGQDDYLVDHSIIMYLMDPDGKFCDYTTKEFTWYESYAKLLRRMTDYEKKRRDEGLPFNEAVADAMSLSAQARDRVNSRMKSPSLNT